MEGSVQRSGEKLRVTVQLIDALKGHHLWSERYDLKMDDLLAVQDEIAMNVLIETQVKLTQGEQALLWRKETSNLKAYEKYLEALMYSSRNNPEDNFKARQLAEEAIGLDPKFSGAYRVLGWCHIWNVWRGWSKDLKRSWQLAGEYAEKALSLDENNSENLALWANVQRDEEKTVEILRRAVEINPNLSLVTFLLGGALFNSGRSEEAIHYVNRAIRLNPLPPSGYFRILGLIYCFDGRYDDALVESKKALDMKPDDVTTWRDLTVIYMGLGQEEKARAAAAEVLRLDPNFSVEHLTKTHWPRLPARERFFDALRKAGLPDKEPLSLAEKHSIAVLPFINMSGDPEQEYFCDGIADQIISAIGKIPYIKVIARTSSFAYKGKSVNAQQIAGDLGVRYILEGSLQRDDENVRINTQLIDAKTGLHLWAENYDRKLHDIFSVQDEICKNIMIALQVKLTVGEVARLMADTVSFKAYEKYLKALDHQWRRTMENSLVARQLAQEAIALDPEYASAYLAIGWTYLDEVWFGMTKTPSESIAKAEEMAQKAASIRGFGEGENALLSSVHLLKKDLDKAIS
jgi:TolB-like protein